MIYLFLFSFLFCFANSVSLMPGEVLLSNGKDVRNSRSFVWRTLWMMHLSTGGKKGMAYLNKVTEGMRIPHTIID